MKTLLSALIGAALAASCLAAGAEESTKERQVQLDIESKTLTDALNDWAQQTGFNLISHATAVTDRLAAPRVKGALTAKDALSQLLEGTSLTYRSVNERTVTINEQPQVTPLAAETFGIFDLEQPRLRLAYLGETVRAGAGATAAQAAPPQSSGEASSDPRNRYDRIEEILVTGTLIRGLREPPLPAITFTRAEIEKTGYSRTEDLFKTLPQNLADVSPTVGEGASPVATDNTDQATAINLRGLGPQSTLVLLNGQRRAGTVSGRVVDVSAIPLSVIERVEIVTGGRSAIYGSDAVAGVVNLVTRRDFEGAETSAYFGAADAGGERLQLSHIQGYRAARGGVVAAYDYSEGSRLDATDAGIVHLPTAFGIVPTPGAYDLLPESTRRSGFLSGRYSLGQNLEIYADGLYTSTDNEAFVSYAGDGFDFFQRTNAESEQYSFSPGLRFELAADWTVDVAGVASRAKSNVKLDSSFGLTESESEAGLSSVTAILDGSALSNEKVSIRTAFGAEGRREDVESAAFSLDEDRTIASAFAEALISLWPADQERYRLQLSVAGRFSDYSDFGESFDPQFGLTWSPSAALTLRGAYSTAFRAPDLHSLNDSSETGLILIDQSDPQQGGAAVPTLIWLGNNPTLDPEEAETWTIGFDFAPAFAPNSRLSVSYFDIQYDERLDEPAAGEDRFVALTNEDRYGGLINRDPSATELDRILVQALSQNGFGNNTVTPFDPETQTLTEAFPNLILFDNRIHNVAQESVKGLDLTLTSAIDTAVGAFSFGLNAVYYTDYERRVTPRSPTFSELNAPSKPVDFKLRANLGWTRSALGAFVYVNYVDDYTDTFASPARSIDSWTTIDTVLRLEGSALTGRQGWLNGLTATFGVTNLSNEEPPAFFSNVFGLGYDPANANALGRFAFLGLTQKW